MLTEEQLAAILRSGDITGAQDDLTNQMALANQLRERSRIVRNDIGSQIGKAGYGIAGAISDYRGLKRAPEITAMKKNLLADLLRKRGTAPNSYALDPVQDPYQ